MQASPVPDKAKLPVHVAIIMDGNGRWATERGQNRSKGHYEGLENAKRIAGAASDLGLKYLTLYVFSTENWKRTKEEVGYLMGLIRSHLRQEFAFYKEHGIRLKCIGNRSGLPEDIQKDIEEAERDTASFSDLTLVLAINYGGRDEIVRSVKKIVAEHKDENSVTEESIQNHFDVPSLPDVDLLIRTGGEKRLSNFLLWHASYAELFFSDTLWPDYTKEELYRTIADFQKRSRRFGAYDKGSKEENKK